MKEQLDASHTAQGFIEAMKAAYPGLPGEAGPVDSYKALHSG